MKSMLVLAAITASFTAAAQKGNWYIGGVTGYSSEVRDYASGGKQEIKSWAVGPEGGTFLMDDFQLGLYLGLSGGSEASNSGDYTYSGFSPTVYGRKFFSITESFSLFAGLYVGLTTGSGKNTYPTSNPNEIKTSGFGIRLGVGIAYALSPRFTVLGQYGLMGYQTLERKLNGASEFSISSFDFGVNTIGSSSFSQGNGSGAVFNIGLYYTFRKTN